MSRPRVFLLSLFIFSLAALTPWLSIDGKQYYMQLRSIVVDGDLNFYNEFAYFHPSAFGRDPELGMRTTEGYVRMWFPLGAPLLCAPFYVAGLGFGALLSKHGVPLIANGYSYPELLGYVVASTLYGLAGLLLSFEVARKYFGNTASLLAVLFIWVASPVMAYLYFEPSMAHSVSILTVSLFLYVWLRWRGALSPSRAFALGLLCGLMAMVRYQDVLFVLFPLWSILSGSFGARRGGIPRGLLLLALLLLGAVISFSPQMILWKAHYGSFLAVPQGRGFFHFLSPAIVSVLFSPYHGLFSWTPILLLAFVGLLAFLRVDRPVAVIALLIFALQVYFSSISKDWWGGWAFGARRFISLTPVFVLGLATLLETRRRSVRSILVGILILLVVWNVLFAYQYYTLKVHPGRGFSLLKVAAGQWDALLELAGACGRALSSPLPATAAAAALLAFGAALCVAFIVGRISSMAWKRPCLVLAVLYFLAWDAVMVCETAATKRIYSLSSGEGGVSRSLEALTLGRDGVFQGTGEEMNPAEGKVVFHLENERPFSRLILVSYCPAGKAGEVVGRIKVGYENAEESTHEIVYAKDTYSPGEALSPRSPLIARTWYDEAVEASPYRTPRPLPLWLLHAGRRLMKLKERPPAPRRSFSANIFLREGGVPEAVEIEAEEGSSLVVTGLAFAE